MLWCFQASDQRSLQMALRTSVCNDRRKDTWMRFLLPAPVAPPPLLKIPSILKTHTLTALIMLLA